MTDMLELMVAPFRRLVSDLATPEAIRKAEVVQGPPELWSEIIASGFLDALVPEEKGGAGLDLSDVFPLVVAAGEFCLPAPFAQTMMARALLDKKGLTAPPDAAIVLAPPSPVIPHLGNASHAIVARGCGFALIELSSRGIDFFHAGGGNAAEGREVAESQDGLTDLLLAAAALTAAEMAGMISRLLAMSIGYASEREQFGRPLSKFQAIQHQLAVMAEQLVSAHVSARIGLSGSRVDPPKVAMAKCRVSEASHLVTGIAHGVHGAIGVTEEFDLQLVSRRLKQAQLAFGSESFWASRLAGLRLHHPELNGADFIRSHLQEMEIAHV